MIAVIFEVWPADDDRRGQYLDIAASLRDDLSRIDGFLSIERFQSLADPDKLLSLSFWRDEEAVREWRNSPERIRSKEDFPAPLGPISAMRSPAKIDKEI